MGVGVQAVITYHNLALLLQKAEALQGQERPDHVFPHPLGLRLGRGPHPAVNREAGVTPGEKPLGPLRAQQLLADKVGQDLRAEDFRQPCIVDILFKALWTVKASRLIRTGKSTEAAAV